MSEHMSQYTEGHTVKSFDAHMEQLRTLVLEMGGLVIDQVSRSVQMSALCVASRADVLRKSARIWWGSSSWRGRQNYSYLSATTGSSIAARSAG